MELLHNLIEQLLNPPTPLQTITSSTVWCLIGVFVVALLLRLLRLASHFTNQASTLLTSIGILGTFLGIVIGLQGVDLSKTATEASVRTLLGGMTLAFTSSLMGMALSILYKLLLTIPPFLYRTVNTQDANLQVLSLLERTAASTDAQNTALERIAEALGTGNFSSTSELLLTMNEMLDQRTKKLVDTSVAQQRQIVQCNESMARLVEALIEDDVQSLSGQFRGLRTELADRHRQRAARDTELVDCIKEMTTDQKQQTQATITVAERQTSLVSLQENTAEIMKGGLDRLASSVKEELETGFERQNVTAKMLMSAVETHGGEQIASLKEQLTVLDNLHRDQQIFSESAKKHFSEINALLSRSPTDEIIDALKATIREFNEHISEQFGDNFAQLNIAVGKLLDWQENYRQQLGDMKVSFDHSVSAIGQISEVVKNVGNSVEQIHDHTVSIPEHMSALGNVIKTNQTHVEILENHLTAFSDTRDRAVEALPKIVEVVQQSVDGMNTAGESISKAINDGSNELKVASGTLTETITTGAQEMQTAFSRSLEGYVKATESVSDTAEVVSQRTQSEVIRLYDHLQETVKQAHQDSAAANQELIRTQFENMGRVRQEETEDVIREMARALAQITGRFTDDYSKLVTAMGEIVTQAANDANR